MDLLASRRYRGYSVKDHTISELSAIGAPTRPPWLAFSILYQALAFAFACGVLRAPAVRPPVRLVGWLLMALAGVGLLWWIAPMHRREVLARGGGDWRDRMHLVLGGSSALLFFGTVGAGAFAFGRRFRILSFATIAVTLVAGAKMSTLAPGIERNAPTPWLGAWERIAVEGSMLWQAVFSAALLLRRPLA
jgi:hypothetical protein